MDPDQSGKPRKVRFAPKVPVRKPAKAAEPKTEVVAAEAGAAQTRDLLRRINAGMGMGMPKADKKSAPVQVAFGQGDTSNFMWSYRGSNNTSSAPNLLSSDGQRAEKEYKEPWNYYSYYPVTLPVRRPYSGDPVLLDEEEFDESSAKISNDEDFMNSAAELGLMEENEDSRMLLLQLPTSLPSVKRSATADVNETADGSKPSRKISSFLKGCRLEEASPGFMGKLQVYKSGIVKLKLGDILYDVSPGSDCGFAQDIVEVNTEEKHCCIVGEPSGRATVTPDVDSLLSALGNLN
ncbi:hypothetical protein Scep_024928 [Stephania cephalantha]|uniref:DNA-directed RNA polymerase III subunit RPC4 n=1 Tax=Stephania cephalantha TaxID=152367 RepID=A0AAP0F4R0_9MAGN